MRKARFWLGDLVLHKGKTWTIVGTCTPAFRHGFSEEEMERLREEV